MTANEALTVGISLVALIMSGMSLYLSLKGEGEKRQLNLIARKHEVVRLFLSVEELIKSGKEALPAIVNLMSNEQRRLHEAALKKVFDDFKEMADDTIFSRKYIEGLNISGRMVGQDTSIFLEDAAGRGQVTLEQVERMNKELRDLCEKVKQENVETKSRGEEELTERK